MADPATASIELSRAGAGCRELSPVGVDFLRFVERHPEALSRSSFALLDEKRAFFKPLQSWPTFLDADKSADMAEANLALFRLLRSIPRRFFDNDPFRLAEFYGVSPENAFILSGIMEEEAVLDAFVGRADFIFGPQGFQCLEFNASATLGGWNNTIWAELYPQMPLVARFLEEHDLEFKVTDTIRILYRHICTHAYQKLEPREKELNIVFTTQLSEEALTLKPRLDRVLSEVLEELDPALRGEVLFCRYPDLAGRSDGIYFGDKRVRVIVEQHQDRTPEAFGCWMKNQVDLYNGVIDDMLGDKKNVVILSENEESEALTAEERRTVREHVPWTRMLRAGEHRYRGERVSLPDFLQAERRRFVLKPADSLAGEGVAIGAYQTQEEWERALGEALQAGDYLVQERVESFPLWYQHGESGCEAFDVVWGHFAFGDDYGGVYLRMVPSDKKSVVSALRGYSSPVLLVEPGAEGGAGEDLDG